MTTTYITTDMSSGFSVAAQGDVVDVLPTGIVSTTGTGAALTSSYGSEIDVFGTVAGGDYGLYSGAAGQLSVIYIGQTGNVDSAYYSSQFANVAVETTGTADIDNYGEIFASGTGGVGVGANGPTTITNHGDITGISGGVFSYDSTAADVITLNNYGAIDSTNDSFQGRSEQDVLFNAGTMTGTVSLSSKSGDSIVNTGTIDGAIDTSNGASLTDSGVINGTVNLSSGSISLQGAALTISGSNDTLTISGLDSVAYLTGGGNTVQFGGSTEYVELFATYNVWDTVKGSNQFLAFNDAQANVFGGNDTIDFVGSYASAVGLYQTDGSWDGVYGSNGTISVDDAQANITGGGDTINLAGSSGNAVDLWGTSGDWDTIYGASGTVSLNDAQANMIGGGDTINFAGSSGDAVDLYSTSGAFDYVYGAHGTLALSTAQANMLGGDDVIDMQGSTGNLVGLYGNAEQIFFQAEFGTSGISGFNATDVITFAKTDFASFAFLQTRMTQSGSNTVITLDSSDTVTLYNTTASSLTSSEFKFV